MLIYAITISFACLSLYAGWAEDTLQQMTLRQKIGQSFIVATSSILGNASEVLASAHTVESYRIDHAYIENLIQDYAIGGIIYLYKNTIDAQRACTMHFQAKSEIPLMIALDAEWGLGMRHSDGLSFPRNMTLGAMQDIDLVYQIGYEIGKQCRQLGVHLNLAPVVDVNNNPNNPVIHDRSFGDDPQYVAVCAEKMIQGIRDAGLLACAKHFPGHGDTAVDSHLGLPVIMHDKARLDDVELVPFKQAIAAGIDVIMTAHIKLPHIDAEYPATLSRTILTDLLRNELGFKGLIVTDGMGMQGITMHYARGQAEGLAYLAGADIILCPVDVPKAVAYIEEAFERGVISMEEIDAKALSILAIKESLELHHVRMPYESICVEDCAHALKRKAYERAITLLGDHEVRYAPQSTFIVIDSIVPTEFERDCRAAGFDVAHLNALPDVALLDKYDHIICASLSMHKIKSRNYGLSHDMFEMMTALKQSGMHTTTILFGSPYAISLVDQADRVIVAYEQDVVMQHVVAQCIIENKKFVGKLPVSLG